MGYFVWSYLLLYRGGDKFFKTLAKLAKKFWIFTPQNRAQLAQNIEIVSEKGKNPRQDGEWVSIFTRQSWILLACGKWLSTPLSYRFSPSLTGKMKVSLLNN
jgi:hypothetical protein